MNVRNCRGCGRIFNYVAGPFMCPACREKMEKKFQEVKEYIRDNPGVGIPQVSQECEVDPSQIQQWLREERLELSESSAINLVCEGCGGPIRSGRYCEKCKYDMTMGFKSVLDSARKKDAGRPKPEDKDPKMRFL